MYNTQDLYTEADILQKHNMNFERGKEPNDAMNIGARRSAIRIKGVGYTIHGEDKSLKEVHDIIAFLRRLKDMQITCDSIFGPSAIFVTTEEGLILELDEFEDKFLKYRDQYYEVASKEAIMSGGFDHLLRNADVHRKKAEEDRERRANDSKMMSLFAAGPK